MSMIYFCFGGSMFWAGFHLSGCGLGLKVQQLSPHFVHQGFIACGPFFVVLQQNVVLLQVIWCCFWILDCWWKIWVCMWWCSQFVSLNHLLLFHHLHLHPNQNQGSVQSYQGLLKGLLLLCWVYVCHSWISWNLSFHDLVPPWSFCFCLLYLWSIYYS